MKKLVFILFASCLTLGAMAQDSARKAGMKDLRKDLRDVNADKKARAADKAAAKTATDPAAKAADISAAKQQTFTICLSFVSG